MLSCFLKSIELFYIQAQLRMKLISFWSDTIASIDRDKLPQTIKRVELRLLILYSVLLCAIILFDFNRLHMLPCNQLYMIRNRLVALHFKQIEFFKRFQSGLNEIWYNYLFFSMLIEQNCIVILHCLFIAVRSVELEQKFERSSK